MLMCAFASAFYGNADMYEYENVNKERIYFKISISRENVYN